MNICAKIRIRLIVCLAIAGSILPAYRVSADVIPADEAAIWAEDVRAGRPSTHIIVKCKPHVADPRNSASHAFGELCAHWRVKNVRKAYGEEFGNPKAAAALGMDRTYILEVPGRSDTRGMARAFSNLKDELEWAEADGIGTVAGFVPNDTNFNLQYGMHNTGQSGGVIDADIDAPEAWDIVTGEENPIIVAVVDSGVTPHTEFADRMVPGTNTANLATPDLTTDGCPHGTHVAGIIAAKGNNVAGIAGVNWGAQIMPVRVFNACSGTETACGNGIKWAADHGAKIINLSVQYYTGTSALNDAVQYARAQGALLIAATGNNQGNVVAFPARFANCMAVSATTRFDLFATLFSNWGPEVDVCAPGDDIWSTWVNDNNYWPMDGTSMATPHVTGLASLIKSYQPFLIHDEIAELLMGTADDKGPAGWDDHFGHGRINAAAAIEAAANLQIQIISSSPSNDAIDARQPSNIDGTNPVGWSTLNIRFDGSVGSMQASDLVVQQDGGAGTTPTVVSVTPILSDTVGVVLSGPINPAAWTSFTHLPSGTSVRLGYLPGDVNGDRVSSPVDILALIDSLNGVGPLLQISSTDINRSGLAEPSDILRLIDLLNGADAFEVYNGVTLP